MEILDKIDQIIQADQPSGKRLQQICRLLKESVPHYHWVGFYFAVPGKPVLQLVEFAGKPTEHTRIPFGKGICGQVAVSNENFVVQDVSEQDNYISCGIDVKSEIVVPIFVKGENIGQIDIDSHDTAPFTSDDEKLLEVICMKVAAMDLGEVIRHLSS